MLGEIAMPKSKKSDSEKAAKDKDAKALKAAKPAKEKKEKKKDKESKAEKAAKPEKDAKSEKKAPAPKKLKAAAVEIVISNDDISLRAYFIAERRQAMGWPGDSTSDWVEAERQLRAEAARKARQ
jgi:hypothetical protein